jgi:L-gulonolactone oxidase
MEPIERESIRLADWSGHTDYGRTEVFAPQSEAEVVAFVQSCRAARKKLRVIGLRTSWNALWYCKDAMMASDRLNAIKEIDTTGRTVTCDSGVPLSVLHPALWEKGLTLNCAPGIDWVSVGGAISTGSHGSGYSSLSSSMIKCRLVTAAGEVVEIGEGDDRLDAVRISLGTLGVLTSVTLRAVPAFHVRVRRSRIPTASWRRFLDEGEMSFVLSFPYTDWSVLVRVDILPVPAEVPRDKSALPRGGGLKRSANEEGTQPAANADFSPNAVRRAVCGLANIQPSTFPARNRYLLEAFYGDSDETGPAHEMLMSFHSDPIAGAEWAVPVKHFDAVLSEFQEGIAKGELYLPVVWLKKVYAESAWLSAADEDCVQCGIYHDVIEGTPSHVKETVTRVERIMLRHGGRPHLGKLICMTPSELKRLYPRWSQFDALRRQMDPDGMFWTELIEARFGAGVTELGPR